MSAETRYDTVTLAPDTANYSASCVSSVTYPWTWIGNKQHTVYLQNVSRYSNSCIWGVNQWDNSFCLHLYVSIVQEIPASENKDFYMFQNLVAARNYSVSVSMRNAAGQGPTATAFVFTPAHPQGRDSYWIITKLL